MNPEHLKPHIQRLVDFNPGEALYITFIQDFLHPRNPEGALRLIATCDKQEAAENALYSAGQRHPGVIFKIKSTNEKFFHESTLPLIQRINEYKLHLYDYAVLCHAPSKFLLERFSITTVYEGSNQDSCQKAAADILKLHRFALMGQVLLMGDSEHGPCSGIVKNKKDGLLRPIR